jgi:hypothetical protein
VLASLPPATAAGEEAKTLAADLFGEASPRLLAGLAELGATIAAVVAATILDRCQPKRSMSAGIKGASAGNIG